MGNVTSNGLGRGGGRSFRRQQKQAPPTPTTTIAAPTSAHYDPQQLQQPTRVKVNKRNKLIKRRQQQPPSQVAATQHYLYPLGRGPSRAEFEQQQQHEYRNWSPDYLDSASHLLHSQPRPAARSHNYHPNRHRIHLDDIHYNSSRFVAGQHHQNHLVSPAASYELLSHAHSNSSSSTAAAGHHPLAFDQYDRAAYSQQQQQHHLNDYYHSSQSHIYHQNPLTTTTPAAYDDCELLPESPAFGQSQQLASMHITQPPSQCLDACCNLNGSTNTTTTTTTTTTPTANAAIDKTTNSSNTATTRVRRMNSPTQCQQQAAVSARRPVGSRRAQNGAAANGANGNAPSSPPPPPPPPTTTGGSSSSSSSERGLALTETERKQRGLLGLLPAAVQSQDLQAAVVMKYIEDCQDELAKYVYLRSVKDFNENLFYYTLERNVEKLMPLVYTPTVGLACQRFSQIYLRPRGLFVSARDAGNVAQLVANWPERDVRVIVMTDGERILGLGDLGANGMGISIGKLSLYTALAGIAPKNVLPVTIDVGTNNETLLEDPFYIGLRQRRVRGDKYEALVEEFMQACVKRWGRSCLIQFEDFANSTAFNLLERHRRNYCTFNDDIQGTASVSLSGLITAARQVGKRLSDCSYLFYGAGEANLGTAQLLVMAMCDEGLTRDEAKKRIWLVDSKGLVVVSRDDLSGHKRQLAQEAAQVRELEAIIDLVKPAAIVGASAQGGSFSETVCKKMAEHNERPIIFALSNPTSKAECTAAQAYEWTEGRCVFASGSPFEPVELGGRRHVPGQGNNAYIFPGVGLACVAAHTHVVPEEAFLVAARALSDQVSRADQEVGLVYPSLAKIREVTLLVATRVLEYLYAERLATYRPEPSDKQAFLRSIQYDPSY